MWPWSRHGRLINPAIWWFNKTGAPGGGATSIRWRRRRQDLHCPRWRKSSKPRARSRNRFTCREKSMWQRIVLNANPVNRIENVPHGALDHGLDTRQIGRNELLRNCPDAFLRKPWHRPATLVAKLHPRRLDVWLQSENGLLGIGPSPRDDKVRSRLITPVLRQTVTKSCPAAASSTMPTPSP